MTDMQKSDAAILKTDGRGRVRTPASRRESLLDEFDRSGLSGAKFAALVGVKHSTFAAWAAKRKRSHPGKATPAPAADPAAQVRWLEAVIDQAQGVAGKGSAGLLIYLGSGARMEISEVRQVELAAALLQALEKPATAC
jgi:hypothetical protein